MPDQTPPEPETIDDDALVELISLGPGDRYAAELLRRLKARVTVEATTETDPSLALAGAVLDELARARERFAAFASPHEGWAVIREELDELWDHVRADTARGPEARKEAIQLAAMALRFIVDLIDAPAAGGLVCGVCGLPGVTVSTDDDDPMRLGIVDGTVHDEEEPPLVRHYGCWGRDPGSHVWLALPAGARA